MRIFCWIFLQKHSEKEIRTNRVWLEFLDINLLHETSMIWIDKQRRAQCMHAIMISHNDEIAAIVDSICLRFVYSHQFILLLPIYKHSAPFLRKTSIFNKQHQINKRQHLLTLFVYRLHTLIQIAQLKIVFVKKSNCNELVFKNIVDDT